jgi:hypothetical protein
MAAVRFQPSLQVQLQTLAARQPFAASEVQFRLCPTNISALKPFAAPRFQHFSCLRAAFQLFSAP